LETTGKNIRGRTLWVSVTPALALGLLLLAAPSCYVQSESQLEKELNQFDTPQSWKNVPVSDEGARPAEPARQPALATPVPEPGFSRSMSSAAQLGNMLKNSPMWRASSRNPASAPSYQATNQGWAQNAFVPQGWNQGPNPFNLTPFQALHYMWDPTTYTSSSNPLTLTEVRNEMQQAEQYSQLAQSAAARAKYASTPAEKQAAASQAQQYAAMAQQAANQAQQISEGGSSSPAEVAALAQQSAAQAQAMAAQAAANAGPRRY